MLWFQNPLSMSTGFQTPFSTVWLTITKTPQAGLLARFRRVLGHETRLALLNMHALRT
jgi:hypothetical protein